VVAPELICWVRSCGTRGDTGAPPPELRGRGLELPDAWQHLSPLNWGAGIQNYGTHVGAWMLVPSLVLTWSLYTGYPVCRVPTVVPRPTSGEAVSPQVGPTSFSPCCSSEICTWWFQKRYCASAHRRVVILDWRGMLWCTLRLMKHLICQFLSSNGRLLHSVHRGSRGNHCHIS
jgi:hypothetical protein